uniref:RxLR effector candidate protein n=2 Tax=Hyaloperonospora arabidopsidis (strain Emoy2) TaxID=559515 RepID=M4B1Q1_HYAAE
MVLKGMNEPRFADEGFVSNAVGNDKPPVDFIGSLLSITVDVRDVEKLLDPLLAVFGGVAKLAPFLAALKKSGTRKHVEHLQRALMMRWLRSGKSVDDIFELLELSKVSKTDLTYEHLDTFVEYFSLYRSKHRYGGGAAKLAPLLAALKKSGTSRHQAEKVQNAMLKRWLVSNTKLDTVFDVLKLSELTERGLTYENLDTFSRYIEVHNERNPRAKTDTFTYLRNKFGGGKLGVMVLKGMNEPRFADEGFVSNAVGNDKPPVDFIGSLLSITVDVRDVEKLLDPLLAVFGGVAKLAPFLAALKKSGTSRHQAEQVQNAMLKRWLVRNTKLDAVFDMLELSELMEKGLTYENLDTFSRYIEVHNEQNPLAKTDTFTYLRNKFGDGKLTVMVLKGMKVPQFADEGFVFNEVGNYQLVANFIDGLLSVVVGVENLLDPLLAAFGDAAKLLTVLKIVKESGICRHEAEQLQRALLTRVAYERGGQ